MQAFPEMESAGAMALGERGQVVFGEREYALGGHRRAGLCRTRE